MKVAWLQPWERCIPEVEREADVIFRNISGADRRVRVVKNRLGLAPLIISRADARQLAEHVLGQPYPDIPEDRTGTRELAERIEIDDVGFDSLEATGKVRVTVLYEDIADGDVEEEAEVSVRFLGENAYWWRYDSEKVLVTARRAAREVGLFLAGKNDAPVLPDLSNVRPVVDNDRGLGLDAVDGRNTRMRVQEDSSSAEGPHVWLFVDQDPAVYDKAALYLDPKQARELALALLAFAERADR